MRPVLAGLVVLVALGCSPRAAPAGLPAGDDATVDYVADGDTLQLTNGVRVRLLNVDTPEFDDCFGAEATARLRELAPEGSAVRLVYDRDRLDRFGRTLAHLYRRDDGRWVNRELVAGGYATVVLFEPNGARFDELAHVEDDARKAGVGLWSACPTR